MFFIIYEISVHFDFFSLNINQIFYIYIQGLGYFLVRASYSLTCYSRMLCYAERESIRASYFSCYFLILVYYSWLITMLLVIWLLSFSTFSLFCFLKLSSLKLNSLFNPAILSFLSAIYQRRAIFCQLTFYSLFFKIFLFLLDIVNFQQTIFSSSISEASKCLNF